jgi:hypothetical protein
MTERETEMKRLYDIAWDTGATSEQLLEQKKSPDIKLLAVLNGIEKSADGVSKMYRFVANAIELPAATRQELCWGILAPYLRTVLSKDAVDEFQKKYPLKDGYDPNFIDVNLVEQRIVQSGLLVNVMLSTKFAFRVLKTALGDPEELTEEDVQQLYYAICRHWKDDLDGLNRTTVGENNNPLPPGLQLVVSCVIVIANAKNLKIKEPADFNIMASILVVT